MRLFVAITPPDPVLDEVEAQVARLRPAWPELRWTSRDEWHVTLAFLGEVSDKAAAALGPELAGAAHLRRPVRMSVGGAGAFPGQSRATVLWAGVQAEQVPMTKLAQAAARAARAAGAPPPGPRRRYHPHLTLARSRPRDLRSLVASLAGCAGPEWTAARIQLIHSRPQGTPRYEELGSWPLRPEPGS
jgi:RNA 2',3'-cyclic 3'-phosphodiesterase